MDWFVGFLVPYLKIGAIEAAEANDNEGLEAVEVLKVKVNGELEVNKVSTPSQIQIWEGMFN